MQGDLDSAILFKVKFEMLWIIIEEIDRVWFITEALIDMEVIHLVGVSYIILTNKDERV